MRFVLYNIRYGTGGKKFRFPWSGYLGKTDRNLKDIISFLRHHDPDIIGLVEVDAGSYRSENRNQAAIIAESLGHYHIYESKYGDNSMVRNVPILNKQGNAFLARDTIHDQKYHYFERGMKKLVIELELENVTLFLVHLALGMRVRHYQMSILYNLIREVDKPVIVAGDFNVLWGEHEIELFLAATKLVNANHEGKPSFPSWSPTRHLDFILHSPEVKISNFWMPDVIYSDHLPLICDFEV